MEIFSRAVKIFRKEGPLRLIEKSVRFVLPYAWTVCYSLKPGVDIHHTSRTSKNAEFQGSNIVIGERCKIRSGAKLITYEGEIAIGKRSTINPYTILYGQGGLEIGDGVRIASHTTIIPANHNYDNPDECIYKQGETTEGITIGDDVWIGTGCRILDGVTIGEGSVVGAGSVVVESIPPYSIAVGSPARVVKSRK